MAVGSILSEDSFCSRVVDAKDLGCPVDTNVLFDYKFDKFFSDLNEVDFYLHGYFLIVCL